MRIAYIAADITVGKAEGGSTHVKEVLERLEKENEVLTVARDGPDQDGIVEAPFIDIPFVRGLAPLVSVLSVYRRVATFDPDVIYERASSYGLGALLSYWLDVPLVVEVNDLKSSPISFRRADRIIATGEVLVPDRYHDKTDIVTWGADVETFTPDNECTELEEYDIRGDTVVGYVGGFYEWHGLEDIVDAASDVENAVFLLVGDGRIRDRIEQRIDERGLQDRFILTGRVPHDQVPGYIACFDVCLAPYNPERHRKLRKTGLFYTPLKNFEYMAAGKPVVTTDTGNLSRMFTDREDALLVPPGSPEALADAINELLADDGLRERLGANARELIVKKHSWDSHCEHLQRLFDEVTA